jgi:hypothetical protein
MPSFASTTLAGTGAPRSDRQRAEQAEPASVQWIRSGTLLSTVGWPHAVEKETGIVGPTSPGLWNRPF